MPFLLQFLYTHINIAHFSASSFLPVSYESAKACAVVVENDSSSSKSSQISNQNNAITNLNGHNAGNPQMRTNIDFSKQGSSSPSTYLSQVPNNGNYQGMQQQEPRNLPPDGTTFNQISLGKRLQQTLPPYGYWNMQFYQVRIMFKGSNTFDIAKNLIFYHDLGQSCLIHNFRWNLDT